MGIPGDRISKAQEVIRREKKQSRKLSRANIVNAKRNLILEKPVKVEPPKLSEAEKLRVWRLEKKKKMDEEKLKRRPPFRTYINVKHTGLSPYKNTFPSTINRIRKIKIGDNATTNPANTRIVAPNTSKQIAETNKQPVMATRITRQTAQNRGLTSKQVPEVENKAVRIIQPSNKTVKSTTTSKKVVKTDKVIKPVNNNKEIKGNDIKTAVKPKKEVRKKIASKENKENVPKLNTENNKLTAGIKKSHYFTRSSTKVASSVAVVQEPPVELPSTSSSSTSSSEESAASSVAVVQEPNDELPSTSSSSTNSSEEPANGVTFQRTRLQEETKKLLVLKDKWSNKEKEDKQLPEHIRDEILSVTGLTTLLVTSKFEQFKSLINDFALQVNNADAPNRIVPEDLDGFWEMMYIQVEQLYNKYKNLENLMQNNWRKERSRPNTNNNKAKKPIIKTPVRAKSGRSRFQDFLNKIKENGKQVEQTCSPSIGTPEVVKNLITARKSRRSSMNIIMSMSGVGKFDISGTALCSSPKPEKKVMFADSE